MRDKDILRKVISVYLSPTEDGGIYGYGSKFPEGDPWDHSIWSDAHDYQHVALDIWSEFNRLKDEDEKKNDPKNKRKKA